MGNVEGLYSQDNIFLQSNGGGEQLLQLKRFEFLAVEEVHKIGVRKLIHNRKTHY